MKYFKFYSLLIITLVVLYSDHFGQHIGSHQLDEENFGVKTALSKFIQSGNDIIELNSEQNSQLTKNVFGYLPDWEYLKGSQKNFRYDLLSHIACFDFGVSSSGSISNPAGWPWTDVINDAHSNGVKVIMVAVNFDADDIHKIMTDNLIKQNFLNGVKSKISSYKLDGINIDFEGLHSSDEGDVINSFIKELSDTVHSNWPEKEVSVATPAVNWGSTWKFSGLADACDYLFIMGYDFYGKWSSSSGPSAPLTGGSKNITNTILNEYSAVTNNNPDKLILGVPYFGPSWETKSGNQGSSVINYISNVLYFNAFSSAQVYGMKWSSTYKTPWYAYENGTWNQTWYDNDSSLSLKYDLVDSKGLRGVGMWALGYDGERQELWNLLDQRYGSGEPPAPANPVNFRVLSKSSSELILSYSFPQRATGFKIYFSEDGVNFIDSTIANSDSVVVENLESSKTYYFKVKAFNKSGESKATEVLGGIPSDKNEILVVNGFDRLTGDLNTRDFIKNYGPSILKAGYSFVSTSNEAVFLNKVSLEDYSHVIWILGDESTADETFNQYEQDKVEKYLENGGYFFLSGAEIGWDLYKKGNSSDKSFYNNYLKSTYIDDAPQGENGKHYVGEAIPGGFFESIGEFNFDDGTHGTIDVDWPDAFAARGGATNFSKFKNISSNVANSGIYFTGNFNNSDKVGKLIHMSIPFETIYPSSKRDELMSKILEFFEISVGVEDESIIPDEFMVYQNYPNPFNPNTTIRYSVTSPGTSFLKIFNSLGELIYVDRFEIEGKGEYRFNWDGKNSNGNKVSSGTYIYQVIFTNSKGMTNSHSNKMILLK